MSDSGENWGALLGGLAALAGIGFLASCAMSSGSSSREREELEKRRQKAKRKAAKSRLRQAQWLQQREALASAQHRSLAEQLAMQMGASPEAAELEAEVRLARLYLENC